MNHRLMELARTAGIEERYTDFYGASREASEHTIRCVLQSMGYACGSDEEIVHSLAQLHGEQSRLQPVYVLHSGTPAEWDVTAEDGASIARGTPLEPGYYELAAGEERSRVIVAPHRAYVPPALERGNLWGLAAQLYSLRSNENWGMGDFGDLRELAAIAADSGAAAVALNPLHELHLTNASSASPYSPASRLHLNALYVDVPGAARFLALDLELDAQTQRVLNALRAGSLVDYEGVARVKLDALHRLHAEFLQTRGPRTAQFEEFRAAGGERLRGLALYEALMEHFKARRSDTYGWMQWPPEYHDVKGSAVERFAQERSAQVAFYEFAQWLADTQLRQAAEIAQPMAIGLYRDLAVGVDANSADVWIDRGAYCTGLCVGAPPDPMNVAGQNWSLPPLNPRVLRQRAYDPYVELLRANMRHAGALRIDHVMGIMRLFCIPRGAHASEGTYVNYRLDEMLGVLALESHRNRCMIVGEDLGTVPPGFRERMEGARIFGCRLMYFERGADGEFCAPQGYTPDAVASTGTHDLAPLAGFWERADEGTRQALLRMLSAHGSLDSAGTEDLFAIILAAYRALARSASRLLLLQLEDVLMQREQVNTPGTFDEVPNWRHKLSRTLAEIASDERFTALARTLNEARGQEVRA